MVQSNNWNSFHSCYHTTMASQHGFGWLVYASSYPQAVKDIGKALPKIASCNNPFSNDLCKTVWSGCPLLFMLWTLLISHKGPFNLVKFLGILELKRENEKYLVSQPEFLYLNIFLSLVSVMILKGGLEVPVVHTNEWMDTTVHIFLLSRLYLPATPTWRALLILSLFQTVLNFYSTFTL